eukprot:scpid46697/ scgid5428/ Alpha-1,2-mannosyltransferase ALG9; Asparagine-linked glycosylation protein 9 homolog; Disrupted in bipolar disorder protein 1 homolog; Dol-P-Man:Man(6)GlcNAc(2)-PP-Dol alpha-1,2-mannosyltransferase; Dol-P-Man:Man(8)GlcNAc(2)-PP-Dol alpha-1,2-mannosyltransferase
MASARERRRRDAPESPSSAVPTAPELANPDEWAPSPSAAFKLFLVACLVSAKYSNISDADETFNYWEPTHFLMFGYGFQTWEYSPLYAIRSYAYNALHAVPAFGLHLLFDKVQVFYGVRVLLGVACALAETYFYHGVLLRFGSVVAQLLLVFLLFGSGMFISCCAFLPSSFAMIFTMVAMGAWFRNDNRVAVFAIAVASCLGWPFAAAVGIPIAIDIMYRLGVKEFAIYAGVSGLMVMVPQIALDSFLYRRLVIAPLNIVLYNVFGQGGPDLYGVEPFSFYFKNAFLNLNIAFILALLVLPMWVVRTAVLRQRDALSWRGTHRAPLWLALLPMYVWMLIFFTRPHKEERFLFPIYPLICMSAAVTLAIVQELLTAVLVKYRRFHLGNYIVIPAILLTIVYTFLGVTRSVALYKGYHAPLAVYNELHSHAVNHSLRYPSGMYNVCVGKEWYRFPSNFFLPDRRWQLQFVRSEFRGQLPQPYQRSWNATFVIPSHMNDMNREETSRYVPEDDCDYIVDVDSPVATHREPRYSEIKSKWKVLFSQKFLDASRSNALFRSFYIPFYSEMETEFLSYNVLQRVERRKRTKK